MKLLSSTRIKRNNRLVFRTIEDVVYVLDSTNNTLHTLNETASFLWMHSQKPTTIGALAKSLATSFGVDTKQANRDVVNFVSHYLDTGYFIRVK